MKKILIVLVLLCCSDKSFAQQPNPDLFDTTWYLSSLTVDGVIYAPPSNSELANVSIIVYQQFLDASLCLGPSIDVTLNDQFLTITSFAILIGDEGCQQPDNAAFEDAYYYGFCFSGDPASLPNPLQYEIVTDSNNNKELTLTNNTGDVAVYGDQLLGINTTLKSHFTISPNPTNDILNLNFPNTSNNRTVTIYSLTGQELLCNTTILHAVNIVDVSGFVAGVYFVQVNDRGSRSVQRFVKK